MWKENPDTFFMIFVINRKFKIYLKWIFFLCYKCHCCHLNTSLLNESMYMLLKFDQYLKIVVVKIRKLNDL